MTAWQRRRRFNGGFGGVCREWDPAALVTVAPFVAATSPDAWPDLECGGRPLRTIEEGGRRCIRWDR